MTRAVCGALALLAMAASDGVVVRREGARVMKGPRFFGEPCGVQVAPGQALRLLERKGGWGRLAEPGGGRCWLHESAWSDRLAGELGGGGVQASQRDVELAGRGFTEGEVTRYRGEHPELAAGFAAVQAYLDRAPEPGADELNRFAAEGRLGGGR